MRKLAIVAIVAALAAALAVPTTFVSAATPDGASGPWADSVESSSQGLRKDGTAVLPERSDPTAALGEAEDDDSSGSYFSLGFGGEIVLGFDNYICNGDGDDIELVEVTNEPYPDERVDVYVSQNGVDFTLAASAVNKDATVPLPAGMPWAKYVKLVDVSDPNLHNSTADAYDIDGVKALHSFEALEMTIDKDVVTDPPIVEPGDQVTYQITVATTTDCTATGVSIWDTLPTGFTYDSTDDISTTGGATRTSTSDPTLGDTTPTWGYWSIPGSGSVTITFTVNVANDVPEDTYDDTAYADGDNFDQIDDLGEVGQDADTPLGQDPEDDEDVTVENPIVVGGEVYPIDLDNPTASAPWFGLALILAAGGGILLIRRRRAHQL